jgi:hypothetical protein
MSGLSSRIAARCAQLTARRCISLPILRNSSSFRSAPGLIVQKRFLASAKPLNASATGSDCVDSHIEETQVSTEIKDADLIFKNVWSSLVAKYGEEHLNFPQGTSFCGRHFHSPEPSDFVPLQIFCGYRALLALAKVSCRNSSCLSVVLSPIPSKRRQF